MPYNREERGFHAQALRGAAALSDMLDCLGQADDHAVAKIVTERELELRALLTFSLDEFSSRI